MPSQPFRSTLSRSISAALLVVTCLRAAACSDAAASQVVLHGDQGSVRVQVEFALTREEQARGLMWREEMPADHGMLFVFESSRPRSFWMKNTPLPLDIVYIGEDLRIVSIAANTTPYSTRSIPSGGPVRYVLEVNGGFCQRHGVTAGSRVDLPEVPRPGSTPGGDS